MTTTTADEAATVTIGSVIEARPWVSGSEIWPVRGIVVNRDPFNDEARRLVWFPALGTPVPGKPVQPIMVSKMQVQGTVETITASWVANACRTLHKCMGDPWTDEFSEISRWPGEIKFRIEQVWKDYNAARRERALATPPATVTATVDVPAADPWARFDALAAAGMDERHAYAVAFGKDEDQVRRDDAIARLRADGYPGGSFDELARAAYRDALDREFLAAEHATRGVMLSNEGNRAGKSGRDLWRQNEAYARRWASEELRQWWDQNGRLTYDQFRRQLLDGTAGRRDRTGGDTWMSR